MFAKTSEVKVLRDPVHGYVHIDLQVIWDIVNSSWFQRYVVFVNWAERMLYIIVQNILVFLTHLVYMKLYVVW